MFFYGQNNFHNTYQKLKKKLERNEKRKKEAKFIFLVFDKYCENYFARKKTLLFSFFRFFHVKLFDVSFQFRFLYDLKSNYLHCSQTSF